MSDHPGDPIPDLGRMALVLSGGGIRAISQIGVIEVLEEYGLVPDVVVGTSGGAIVGALYASGKTPSQMTEIAMSWRDRGNQLIDYNWMAIPRCLLGLSLRPFTGVLRGSKLARAIRSELGQYQRFQELCHNPSGKPLFVTSVDLNDGCPVVFCDPARVAGYVDPKTGEYQGYVICGREGVVEAVRASYSIPGVFVPARCEAAAHGGSCPRADRGSLPERYVDGAVRDNCPLNVAVRVAGAGLVLAVNLGYAGMRRDKVANGGIIEILGQVADITGDDQLDADLNDEVVSEAKVAVINPMIYDVGTFELEYIPQLIDRGRQVARRFLIERGLTPGKHGFANRFKLFSPLKEHILFPMPGTAAYEAFPPAIKSVYSGPKERNLLRKRQGVSR